MSRWTELRAEVTRWRDDAYVIAAEERAATHGLGPPTAVWDVRGSAFDEVLGRIAELDAAQKREE